MIKETTVLCQKIRQHLNETAATFYPAFGTHGCVSYIWRAEGVAPYTKFSFPAQEQSPAGGCVPIYGLNCRRKQNIMLDMHNESSEKQAYVYLDNAATTLPDSAVVDVIGHILRESFANSSSLYREGLRSHETLRLARQTVAGALGCADDEVCFTATGTEANNLAVLGCARARSNFGSEVVVSGYEHSGVFDAVMSLADEGFRIKTVNPGADGNIDGNSVLSLVNKKTALVAVMQVNNETGALSDVASLSLEVKKINPRCAFHCDMVQGFLKHPVSLSKTGIDTASVSAHKIHGPKGVGALYLKRGLNIRPVFFGSAPWRGIRGGTENVAYAAAFAKAVEVFDAKKGFRDVTALNRLLRGMLSDIDGVVINSPKDASPYILNFSFLGYRSETLLHYLDDNGVMVSSGSACSKGAASRALQSMGLSKDRVDSAVRVSFSKNSSEADVTRLISLLSRVKESLISSKR